MNNWDRRGLQQRVDSISDDMELALQTLAYNWAGLTSRLEWLVESLRIFWELEWTKTLKLD